VQLSNWGKIIDEKDKKAPSAKQRETYDRDQAHDTTLTDNFESIIDDDHREPLNFEVDESFNNLDNDGSFHSIGVFEIYDYAREKYVYVDYDPLISEFRAVEIDFLIEQTGIKNYARVTLLPLQFPNQTSVEIP